jgi:hypothetical protein
VALNHGRNGVSRHTIEASQRQGLSGSKRLYGAIVFVRDQSRLGGAAFDAERRDEELPEERVERPDEVWENRCLDQTLSTQPILQFEDSGDREGQKGNAAACRPVAKEPPRSLDHDAGLPRARARRDERRACMLDHSLLLLGRLERLGSHFTRASIAVLK